MKLYSRRWKSCTLTPALSSLEKVEQTALDTAPVTWPLRVVRSDHKTLCKSIHRGRSTTKPTANATATSDRPHRHRGGSRHSLVRCSGATQEYQSSTVRSAICHAEDGNSHLSASRIAFPPGSSGGACQLLVFSVTLLAQERLGVSECLAVFRKREECGRS